MKYIYLSLMFVLVQSSFAQKSMCSKDVYCSVETLDKSGAIVFQEQSKVQACKQGFMFTEAYLAAEENYMRAARRQFNEALQEYVSEKFDASEREMLLSLAFRNGAVKRWKCLSKPKKKKR